MKLTRSLRRRGLWVLVAAAAVLFAPIAATMASADDAHSNRPLLTIMVGEQEPAGGDADAIGLALIRIDTDTSTVCYLLLAHKIDGTIVAAHIHRAPAGVNGPIVVPLMAPVDGFSRACVTIAPALAAEIAGNPSGFYVNVHSTVFPGGAIRGQL